RRLVAITAARSLCICVFILAVICLCSCREQGMPSQRAITDLQLLDLSGSVIDPFAGDRSNVVVFVFVRTDCPISNRYIPEIRRLNEKFRAHDVSFWLVHSDPDTSVDEIRRHSVDYPVACGVLRDPRQRLVRLCKARVTPEAAVFAPGKRLVYHGRIDDRVAAFGADRPTPTRRELEEVLTAITEGKPVT